MNKDVAAGTHVNNTPVAFFDFDGTLTTSDTLMPFLKFVVGKPKYYFNLLLVSPVLVGYFLKLVRNDIAKEIVLKQYLAGYHIDELFFLGERFSNEIIPTMLRPEGMERLRWHQEQGHDCILVSASLDIWLNHWSSQNDIKKCISTSLYNNNGIINGELDGSNCFGSEKKRRILSFFSDKSLSVSYAYGDSKGDCQMLSIIKNSYIWSKDKFKKYQELK